MPANGCRPANRFRPLPPGGRPAGSASAREQRHGSARRLHAGRRSVRGMPATVASARVRRLSCCRRPRPSRLPRLARSKRTGPSSHSANGAGRRSRPVRKRSHSRPFSQPTSPRQVQGAAEQCGGQFVDPRRGQAVFHRQSDGHMRRVRALPADAAGGQQPVRYPPRRPATSPGGLLRPAPDRRRCSGSAGGGASFPGWLALSG